MFDNGEDIVQEIQVVLKHPVMIHGLGGGMCGVLHMMYRHTNK